VRILLDECVPARLVRAFPDHAVQSVTQIGWRSSKDGPPLEFAQGRFDVFVTVDRQLEKQNDLGKLKLGFVIARVPNNRLDGFVPIFDELNAAAQNVRSGEVIYVTSPEYSSR
jgi:predicted nuclease of predicted toxin-antitoxin system